jgi:biotin carboxyl carrier protein
MADQERPTTEGHDRATIARLAADTLPRLMERLAKSELGELEVREDGWRIRLRRPVDGASGGGSSVVGSSERARQQIQGSSTGSHVDRGQPVTRVGGAGRTESSRGAVTSPAVGYFVPRAGVVVGSKVASGDLIGHVDVLGVRQEVVAPMAGVVGELVVESGQAIEYGQRIARVEPAEANV